MYSSNKPIYCRNNCGVRIKFSPTTKSESGKMIPLEYESGVKHQCPNSSYAQKDKPLNPNYGNLYSGNELTIQKNRQSQESDMANEANNTIAKHNQMIENLASMEGVREEMLLCMQELVSIAKDIRGLMLQKDNPNPTISKASDINKKSEVVSSELGLSDPEDNDVEDTPDLTDHHEEREFDP